MTRPMPRPEGLFAFASIGALLFVGSVHAAPAKKKAASAATATAPEVHGPPPADSSPLAELKKANASAKKIMQKQRPDWSPEADHQNAELKKIVDSLLDIEELSRRALGRHWDEITPQQRKEFVATLGELVNRSYVRQVYGQPDYDLKFDKETKTGSEAVVTATLTSVTRGKKLTVAIENNLIYKKNRWVVYDLITDEQSLLENYRAEFNKIIAKESFDGLMKRMKKKLLAQNEKQEKQQSR